MIKASRSSKSKPKKKTSYERRAENKVNLSVYIDRKLKEHLKKKAEDNEMSMTDYLVYILQLHAEEPIDESKRDRVDFQELLKIEKLVKSLKEKVS